MEKPIAELVDAYMSSENLASSSGPASTSTTAEISFQAIGEYLAHGSMQDLIELLEERLIGEDERLRHRATALLAELFHAFQPSLQAPVIHLYVVFFNHRLSDFPSLIPSLHALLALVTHYGALFDAKYCDAIDIFQTLLRTVHVPSQAQNVRIKVLTLLGAMLEQGGVVASLQNHASEVVEG
eukprot:CAMPEP_0173210500 /NCGR_PEP_ID=MMETSP1141-20130122/23696_1 /TAXON_ID=483371 /ORGANISM="non described non described, Strain CCMP2298" /LENGTH=182 /DNA_ID=CAMNT_0014137249 /DNA_START=70 /DNA_END=614 /DNA_ORIENTATION=-